MAEEREPIGRITHFFPKIGVAVVKADETIRTGDRISIEGRGKVVEMAVESMQINHKDVDECNAGEEAGLKVPEPVKEGDLVFRAE